jgi:hypothetical protein
MTLIHNERIKFLANILNGAANSPFAVGVLAPMPAAFYSVRLAKDCKASRALAAQPVT